MIYFGAAYYPEHRPEEYWESDCDLMREAHVNALRVGEFAWSRFEPEEGKYDWEWIDRFLDTAYGRGIQVLLCPPLRTHPQWLTDNYPEVMIEREDHVRLTFGGRYRYCINNPKLIEKGKALFAEIAERYGNDERICGFHLDNEQGCEHDCHCPVCQDLFRTWCRNHYNSIEELNHKWGLAFWGLQFTSFDSILSPRAEWAGDGPGHQIAWRRFRSDSTVESIRWQVETMKQHSDKLVTTNNQPIHNFRTDYYQMAVPYDQTGTNYYPPLSGDTRAIILGLTSCRCYKGPGRNFQVHELRNAPHMISDRGRDENRGKPGAVERITMHAVGHGADATYYFRWDACPFGNEQNHGTVQGYDGKPRRIYTEVQKVGEKLKRLSPELEGSTVPSEIALFLDFPTRWDVETNRPFTGGHHIYIEKSKMLHRVLRDQGYSVDTCSRHTYWSQYKMVVFPQLSCCTDQLAGKIISYLENGGTVVWHPLCGMKDEDGNIFPERIHPELVDIIGCRIQESEPAGADDAGLEFEYKGKKYKGEYFADLPEEADAEWVKGTFTYDWLKDEPAVIEKEAGKGKLFYCTTFAQSDFYSVWFPEVGESAWIKRILPEAPPADIELCERRKSDGTRLLFVLNQSDETASIELPEAEDVYNQEQVKGKTELPSHGVRVIKL